MKIHELLATPDKWTQGEFARNNEGLRTGSCSPSACCWCLLGALNHCYKDGKAYSMARKAITAELDQDDSIDRWNDDMDRTHAEVLELVKRLDV